MKSFYALFFFVIVLSKAYGQKPWERSLQNVLSRLCRPGLDSLRVEAILGPHLHYIGAEGGQATTIGSLVELESIYRKLVYLKDNAETKTNQEKALEDYLKKILPQSNKYLQKFSSDIQERGARLNRELLAALIYLELAKNRRLIRSLFGKENLEVMESERDLNHYKNFFSKSLLTDFLGEDEELSFEQRYRVYSQVISSKSGIGWQVAGNMILFLQEDGWLDSSEKIDYEEKIFQSEIFLDSLSLYFFKMNAGTFVQAEDQIARVISLIPDKLLRRIIVNNAKTLRQRTSELGANFIDNRPFESVLKNPGDFHGLAKKKIDNISEHLSSPERIYEEIKTIAYFKRYYRSQTEVRSTQRFSQIVRQKCQNLDSEKFLKLTLLLKDENHSFLKNLSQAFPEVIKERLLLELKSRLMRRPEYLQHSRELAKLYAIFSTKQEFEQFLEDLKITSLRVYHVLVPPVSNETIRCDLLLRRERKLK